MAFREAWSSELTHLFSRMISDFHPAWKVEQNDRLLHADVRSTN